MSLAAAPVIVWFRDDLRLSDNPALSNAAASGAPIIAVYLLDEESHGLRPLGGAARWWLHHALEALQADLAKASVTLVLLRGPALETIPAFAKHESASAVCSNRRYGHAASLDQSVAEALKKVGVESRSFQASLLFEPGEVVSKADKPFQVFTAFWRAARTKPLRDPLPRPRKLVGHRPKTQSDKLAAWKLLPTRPDWAGGLRDTWKVSEAAAQRRLRDFVDGDLADYPAARDLPGEDRSSRLSPYLRFGQISPFQVRTAVELSAEGRRVAGEKFLAEIGWREFNWQLLAGHPDMARKSLLPDWDDFPWLRRDRKAIRAWQRGETGIPIVDAGMRQLWQTGFMHNRVRMIVGSFLTKHLLQDWRIGEEWFWDTLCDADAGNNPGNWQWVAGSGADASPFFRVFNPVLQGERFDADGAYVRRYLPELATLSGKALHAPWLTGGVRIYPPPVVDLARGRERALQAYQEFKARTRKA